MHTNSIYEALSLIRPAFSFLPPPEPHPARPLWLLFPVSAVGGLQILAVPRINWLDLDCLGDVPCPSLGLQEIATNPTCRPMSFTAGAGIRNSNPRHFTWKFFMTCAQTDWATTTLARPALCFCFLSPNYNNSKARTTRPFLESY